MQKKTSKKPDYSNWVSARFIYVPWVISLLFVGLSFVLPVLIIIGILGLKLTDMNAFWALLALGMVVGCHGGISVSQRARV